MNRAFAILLLINSFSSVSAFAKTCQPGNYFISNISKHEVGTIWDGYVKVRFNGVIGNQWDGNWVLSISSNVKGLNRDFHFVQPVGNSTHATIVDREICPNQELTFDCAMTDMNSLSPQLSCRVSVF